MRAAGIKWRTHTHLALIVLSSAWGRQAAAFPLLRMMSPVVPLGPADTARPIISPSVAKADFLNLGRDLRACVDGGLYEKCGPSDGLVV